MFKPILDVSFDFEKMSMEFIKETKCSQNTEHRTLDSIRPSLLDPKCTGPEIVYGINMDVYQERHLLDIQQRNQLYGVVMYASGKLGQEAVRSQGHLHAISPFSQTRTGEVYQIWQGEAYICMQKPTDNGGFSFYAVHAKPGDIVVVHHDWIHATVNANPNQTLIFGAWCCRDYAFEYDFVREKKGMAYYPIYNGDKIEWIQNQHYEKADIIVSTPPSYEEFNIKQQECIYKQYAKNKDLFDFITNPNKHLKKWDLYKAV